MIQPLWRDWSMGFMKHSGIDFTDFQFGFSIFWEKPIVPQTLPAVCCPRGSCWPQQPYKVAGQISFILQAKKTEIWRVKLPIQDSFRVLVETKTSGPKSPFAPAQGASLLVESIYKPRRREPINSEANKCHKPCVIFVSGHRSTLVLGKHEKSVCTRGCVLLTSLVPWNLSTGSTEMWLSVARMSCPPPWFLPQWKWEFIPFHLDVHHCPW